MYIQKNIFESFPSIQTKNLSLRKITSNDAKDFYHYYQDPNVYKYSDWDGPSSLEESSILFNSWNKLYEEKKLIPWGISLHNDNSLIGTVLLMPVRGTFDDLPRFPLTIGYDLQSGLWNQGIMTEALNAILEFSKENISLHRIQAEVIPGNIASIKLLIKLGFEQDGYLRQYVMHSVSNYFLDVIMFSLIVN
ncbi:GNAT family N-acetyltransferase [Paenibacillus endoradicis]|uniref:GNAT family N-acetyltransferase n=1 Tax=Paenibacillus endoradicis TaxID=2972487 RepID=UPI002159218D|nr:GNAT family protein [Paenibacillus endoradicis]MCR8658722.1 GNAT family N-acetyltransferase [Paenibacillus endoradicis]